MPAATAHAAWTEFSRARLQACAGAARAFSIRTMNARRAVLCLALGETILWAGLYYLFPALWKRFNTKTVQRKLASAVAAL